MKLKVHPLKLAFSLPLSSFITKLYEVLAKFPFKDPVLNRLEFA